jgi:hypothetical protein
LEITDVIARDVNVRERRETNISSLLKKELVELSMLLATDGQSRISTRHIKEDTIMGQWCAKCHFSEQTGEYMSCSQQCPVFGKCFEELANYCVQEFLKSKEGKTLQFKLFKERCAIMPQYNEFDFISNINKRFGTIYHAERQEKKYKITWETWFEDDDGKRYDERTSETFITHDAMYKRLFDKEFAIKEK